MKKSGRIVVDGTSGQTIVIPRAKKSEEDVTFRFD